MSTPSETEQKKPSQVYFTDETKRKIKWLAFHMDTSQSDAVSEAVERMYDAVREDLAKQPTDPVAA